MEYVYPAIFDPNEDGSFTITYPDLPGCISEGKSLANAMYMAQVALTEWIEYLTDKNHTLPIPSDIKRLETSGNEFANLVRAEIKDKHAVRRTVSIPKWMDDSASQMRLSLSRVLQEALRERIAE